MNTRYKAVTPAANLSDQVANTLSIEIRSSRYSVGEKLPTEAALAEQFAVSRTVVREAMSRLKSLHLVESRQGSGVFVLPPGYSPLNFDASSAVSKQAVIQMVEVRRALEAEVAALAAERRSAEDIERIYQAKQALANAVNLGGDGVEEDVNYHQAIADAAKNPFLISTLNYLRQFLRGATRVTRANEARRQDFAAQVQEEHAAIADAIDKGDVALARLAATAHMDNAIKRIEQAEPEFWQEEGVKLAVPLVNGSSSI